MNDEQMQPLLKAWLRDREIPRPQVQTGVAKVMANVPRTRQRGRWWPLPVFHRKAQTATAADTTEYQPSPIPATNGHVPIVIGRTQTMFNPAKAITAALVLGIGGVLLVAQPFDQRGSAPGAEIDAPGPAAYIHGTATGQLECCGDEVETYDDDGNRLTLRGSILSITLTMDDPRLSGDLERTSSIDEFPQPDTDERVEVHWGELTITNDQGGWSGTCKGTYDASQFPKEVGIELCELTGTEAYEGLSAFLVNSEGREFNGAIFPGPLPPHSAYGE